MTPSQDFIGVVICKGTSAGDAANKVINKDIVESERAQIVMIPPEREGDFIDYQDRLLTAEEITKLFPTEPLTSKYLDNDPL